MNNSNRLTSRYLFDDFVVPVNDKNVCCKLAINDKIVVAEMRKKNRIDFLSAATLMRHPPLSGAAATKIGALSPWASCAVLISKEGWNYSRLQIVFSHGVYLLRNG